ncbi:MAG: hypothetical protein DI586_04790 [Micavibrio aeruginosavorus]|uniref:Glycosyl transferase family 1 domain-containing protein n=1 Tax=Micavibrio aeruginosavorus TaxID=349221 RepID=A0A2W5FM45_9BACT|nr:MAG: hypothetical protein DI586_04790 [Micavibrio aeruginosavorus]
MKIARIGAMYYPYPPLDYGGTERSMSQLTYFQAMAGHDVTLYGPSNSTIVQEMAEIAHKYGFHTEFGLGQSSVVLSRDGVRQGSVALRTTGYEDTTKTKEPVKLRTAELVELLLDDADAAGYDLIHCHYAPSMRRIIEAGYGEMTICQLHNPDPNQDFNECPFPIMAISDHQALDLKLRYQAEIIGVAHHGLDRFNYDPTAENAGYLASISRIDRDKGQDLSIASARLARKPLIIAGQTTSSALHEDFYFTNEIKPYIDICDTTFLTRHADSSPVEIRAELDHLAARLGKPNVVIFVGPANEQQKQVLYGNALATMFPIRWPEPFGRVMIESMACGTPVIGNEVYQGVVCGAVHEVIDDYLSGIKVSAGNDQDAIVKLAEAIKAAENLDRFQVRDVFERRWTSEANAARIEELYNKFFADRQRERFLSQSTVFDQDGYSSPAVA